MYSVHVHVVSTVLYSLSDSPLLSGTLPTRKIGGSPRPSTSTFGSTNEETELEEMSLREGSHLNWPEDLSLAPAQYLVPAWECLQEVYKPAAMQLKGGALDFQALIPDMLFADLPPTSYVTIPEDYMVGIKIQEAKGMFMRYYYTACCNGNSEFHEADWSREDSKFMDKTNFSPSWYTCMYTSFVHL